MSDTTTAVQAEEQVMEASTLAPVEPFTAFDRCDRCGAQAYVEVVTPSREGVDVHLKWCAHHYTRFETALLERGTVTRDERERLHQKLVASY